jgi:hypothetical protein
MDLFVAPRSTEFRDAVAVRIGFVRPTAELSGPPTNLDVNKIKREQSKTHATRRRLNVTSIVMMRMN